MTVTNYLKFLILTLMCLFIGASSGLAATVYVDAANEGGTEDGTSWATAWGTIQEGVDDPNFSGSTGNTVLVATGTYNEQVDLIATHSGAPGSLNAIVSSGTVIVDGAGNCFRLDDADYIKIKGIECTGATGSGIYLYYSDGNLIESCNIYDNTSRGIHLYESDGNLIESCNIYDNTSDGIYVERYCYNNTFQYCILYRNGGSGIYGGRDSYPNTILACNIYSNHSYGIYVGSEVTFTVKNSIIVNNGEYGLRAGGSGIITATYNDVYGHGTNYYNVTAGIGSISANPGFVEPYNGDVHLYADSPCVGAGESGVDMGFYPSGPTTPVSSNTYYVDGVSGLDINDGSEAFPWEHIQHAADTMIAGDTVIIKPDTYLEDVLITKGGTESSPITYTSSGTVIVDGVGYGFRLDNVSSVAIERLEFTDAGKGVFLEDSFGNTITSCTIHDNTGIGLHLDNSNKTTITNNTIYNNTSRGIYLIYSNGNLIEYCNIHDNTSRGIRLSYSDGNLIEYCNIYDNTSDGIYLSEYCDNNTIQYSIFYRNGGTGIRGYYNSYSNTVLACNIYSNHSYGIYIDHTAATFTVKDSIIVNNGRYGLYAGGSGVITATYNNVYGHGTNYYNVTAGIGSISANPGFVEPYNGDVHLYADSPCVGAGEGGVDMGIYPGGPTTPVSSNTYYVDGVSGLDTNDGSEAFPWEHIQHAADTMLAGDTVIIKPDTYLEDVLVTRGGTESSPITYTSSGTVIVDGANYGFRLDNVSSVTIEKLEFTDAVQGVFLEDSFGNTITSCTIHDNNGIGLYLDNSNEIVITNNTIYNNTSRGIYLIYSNGNLIASCSIYGNMSNGIYLYYSNGNLIASCNIYNNTNDGIYLDDSDGNLVEYCDIYDNTSDGISLEAGCSNNTIQYSILYRNGRVGIYGYVNCYSNTVLACDIYSNHSYGIYISHTANTFTVKNSIIVNNYRYGLYAEDSGVITATYNDVYGHGTNYYNVTAGEGSINANPGFVDPYNGDVHLYSDSPCVGAGEGGVDMGFYPSGPTTPVSSNTYYVDGNSGLDTNDGSQAFPWETIQHAADTMIAGDTVIVLPDTYYEQVSIVKGGTSNNPIIYRSSGTVVVNGSANCFGLDNVSNVVIEGFKLTSATHGVFLNRSYDNTIHSCDIYDNSYSGIYLDLLSSNNTIQYCNIYRSGAVGIYGYDRCSSNLIHDCVVYSNTINGILADDYSSFAVENTIVSNSGSYGLRAINSSTITDNYNDVYNNGTNYDGCAPGVDSISQDPLFVSTISGIEDFHLKSGSPCIGTGKPNPTLMSCIGTYDIYNTLTDDYASATTTHKITFTTGKTIFGINGSIPSDGKIRITYPSGFDLTGVSSSATSTTIDGTFSVGVSAQAVTITRSGGSATTNGQTEDISIDNVVNHNTAGDYTLYWETLDSGGSTIEGPVKSNNFKVYFDTIPPAAVDDLTATTCGTLGGAVDLTWTAPKEDGDTGGAVTSYDVRYATISFTDADWDASWVSQATGEPSPPKSPGEIENFIVGGLDSLTTYYFAIKSVDDVNNTSLIDTKTSSLNQTYAMASDNTPTPPEVTVNSPNGFENLSSTYTITWTYSDFNTTDTHTFEVKLSSDGGTSYSVVIASGLPDGTTYYTWNTLLHANGANIYKIKVIATDSGSLSGEDESDDAFSIVNINYPPSVIVTAPNGGNVIGNSMIVWEYSDPNGDDTHTFDVELSTDKGNTYSETLASGLPDGTTYYLWNTSIYPDGENYKIKVIVTDNGGLNAEDTSDEIFNIINNNSSPNTFSLLSPTNGTTQNTTRPTFDWENSSDPDGDSISYTLWYSTESNFNSRVEVSGLTISQWKPSTNLSDETRYYWKVKVEDSNGLTRWANEINWYFTISRTRIASDDGCVYVVIHSGLSDNGYVNIDKKTTSNSSSLLSAHQETRSNPLLKATSGNGYEINVYDSDNDSLISNITINATITMYYQDGDDDGFLDGTTIKEKYLRIFRLNGEENRWQLAEGEQSKNTTANSISVDVSHFSTYAVFAYARPTGILCKASNYPNPFAAGEESTTISYILTKDSKVTIRMYNLVGDLVREMEFDAGDEGGTGEKYGYNNRIEWDGRNGDSMKVSNGAYICQIIAKPEDGSGMQEEVRKIGVLK